MRSSRAAAEQGGRRVRGLEGGGLYAGIRGDGQALLHPT